MYKKGNQRTFEDIAKSVFNRILHEAVGSKKVDVIFDVYRDISIKNIERPEKRDSSVLPKHKVQQWQQFLEGSENKQSFIRFLSKEWSKNVYVNMLNGKDIYVAYDED